MAGRGAGRAQPGGFTLVEVLMAISLVGLIMAMAYGGFRAGVRSTGSGEVLIEETNRLRVAHEFVRRQLSLAQPLIIESDQDVTIRFEGERDRVRFIAPMPGYLSFGGAYVQEFRLARGAQGLDLIFSYALLNGYEPGDLDRVDPVPILEGLASGGFEFLGFSEDALELFWDRVWPDSAVMPVAVLLDLELNQTNGLFWPELVTPLRIDSGATQPRAMVPDDVLDPASRRRARPSEQ